MPLAMIWFSTVLAMLSATSSSGRCSRISVPMQLLAVPGQRACSRATDSTSSMLASVTSTACRRRVAVAAHADALARQLAVLAVALVGGDDRRVALLGQHDLDQVLHVLDVRNAPAVLVGGDVVFAARSVSCWITRSAICSGMVALVSTWSRRCTASAAAGIASTILSRRNGTTMPSRLRNPSKAETGAAGLESLCGGGVGRHRQHSRRAGWCADHRPGRDTHCRLYLHPHA